MDYLINFYNGLMSFASKYAIWFILFIAPIHQFLYLTYVLLFLDFITGVCKALKQREPITSKRMRDTTIKFMFYTVPICAAYFIDITYFSGAMLYITKLIAGFIALTEFKSLLENVSVLTGVDLWLMVQDKLMDYFNSKLKSEDKGKEKENETK
jgi:hypothetical protein